MSEPVNEVENVEDTEIVEYISSNEYDDYEENNYCENNCCEHTFEVDLFDIDPDRAQEITYCTTCFFILKR